MIRIDLPRKSLFFVISMALLSMLVGLYLAISTKDAHWVQRAGALIAAIGAASILVQVRYEITIDEKKERLRDKKPLSDESTLGHSPLGILAEKLQSNRLKKVALQLHGNRIFTAQIVALIAIAGELLHGFGDIFLCLFVPICQPH